MKKLSGIAALFVSVVLSFSMVVCARQTSALCGDVNDDTKLDPSAAVYVLNWLFLGAVSARIAWAKASSPEPEGWSDKGPTGPSPRSPRPLFVSRVQPVVQPFALKVVTSSIFTS